MNVTTQLFVAVLAWIRQRQGGSVAKFVRIGEFSALDGVRSWRMNDFKGRHFGSCPRC